MLGGESASCQGGADLILGEGGELLPDLFDAAVVSGAGHFLLEVSDFQIIALLHFTGQRRDQTQNAF